ncbi:hypothetical protein NW761_003766 [Fusarium oxysporum]|nr:hypothetical protein NW758_011753 [Fusarium oxysporum]KAJ4065880.1 hypothetical protein NW763_002909 [Fusarium oxysporum]KAJ4067008.1 hypothetical protein NW753_002089 [Fusarium oxysporum]KAJ4091877.1 hypothetical protein NW756_006091 [Fusarium oxysporum]KAJ4097380.1 hypothetical protein NW769_011159 [Fusarium oxysporum]
MEAAPTFLRQDRTGQDETEIKTNLALEMQARRQIHHSAPPLGTSSIAVLNKTGFRYRQCSSCATLASVSYAASSVSARELLIAKTTPASRLIHWPSGLLDF